MRTRVSSFVAVAATLVLGTTSVAQAPSEAPASPEGPAEPAIVWDSGAARLEADSYKILAGDSVFTGVGPADVDSDPGDPTYRTLEIVWQEQGVEQRMNLYLAADETDWWVTEIRTYDGFADGEWINYAAVREPLGEMFRTPRGGTFKGDVRLVGWGRVPSEVVIEGLRLTAFAPGTGPGALTDCKPATTKKKELRRSPLRKGQLLHDSGIKKMTPEDAEALLRDRGICFTFRYSYPVIDTDFGYSERWCTAPPAGKVGDLSYLDDGEVVVFVEDKEPRPERAQPPQGWNCPAG
jgi:hypothetical protein